MKHYSPQTKLKNTPSPSAHAQTSPSTLWLPPQTLRMPALFCTNPVTEAVAKPGTARVTACVVNTPFTCVWTLVTNAPPEVKNLVTSDPNLDVTEAYHDETSVAAAPT